MTRGIDPAARSAAPANNPPKVAGAAPLGRWDPFDAELADTIEAERRRHSRKGSSGFRPRLCESEHECTAEIWMTWAEYKEATKKGRVVCSDHIPLRATVFQHVPGGAVIGL